VRSESVVRRLGQERVLYMCVKKCRGVVCAMPNQNFGEGEGNFSPREGGVGHYNVPSCRILSVTVF